MTELGYVITKRCSKEIPNFVGCIHSQEEIEDPTKPYLIIGYKNAKEIIGEKFNILNKRIDGNHFWTFSKTEKRTDFDKDTRGFYDFLINNAIDKLKYYYINIFSISFGKKKKLIEILNSNEKKYIYICGQMIYVYNGKYIMGISLNICKYCHLNVKKIIKRLYENSSNRIYTTNTLLDDDLKQATQNKNYAVAYFISLIE